MLIDQKIEAKIITGRCKQKYNKEINDENLKEYLEFFRGALRRIAKKKKQEENFYIIENYILIKKDSEIIFLITLTEKLRIYSKEELQHPDYISNIQSFTQMYGKKINNKTIDYFISQEMKDFDNLGYIISVNLMENLYHYTNIYYKNFNNEKIEFVKDIETNSCENNERSILDKIMYTELNKFIIHYDKNKTYYLNFFNRENKENIFNQFCDFLKKQNCYKKNNLEFDMKIFEKLHEELIRERINFFKNCIKRS